MAKFTPHCILFCVVQLCSFFVFVFEGWGKRGGGVVFVVVVVGFGLAVGFFELLFLKCC